MVDSTYTVRAEWDPEASVWVATSDDVPGLITEADTIDALATKLRAMVPELLELNGVLPAPVGDVPIELVTKLPPLPHAA
jgi:predicted RNase H-like HicB family nuclease